MPARILQYSDVENAYDRPERIGRLAGLIEELRDEETLVVGTGDTIAPGVLSLVTEGRQAMDFFARVEPDLATFGNHDFDHGPDATRGIVADAPQTWVATNVYQSEGPPGGTIGNAADRFGADAGVVPTAIREVAGTRLGFLGVLDPATPEVTPTASDLVVTDPVEATRRATADLRARGADQVVTLSHVGRSDDEIARETDVDVVLGGHVHASRIDRIEGTLLTRPGANARRLVELRYVAGDWSVDLHDVTGAPIEETVAGALRERVANAGLDATVATVDRPIERTDDAVFSGPCRIGQVVAGAYRWATGTDVGLQNSGGIRAGPPLAGEVTVADLVSVIPFEEPVVVVELSGRELRAVLAERDGRALDPVPDDRWMGHASGVAESDASRGEIVVDGAAIDPGETYTLATSDYLCYTDGEFPTLTGRDPVERTGRSQYEVLVDYAHERDLHGGRRADGATPRPDNG